jgi:serine/threonine-protein kinase PRP4
MSCFVGRSNLVTISPRVSRFSYTLLLLSKSNNDMLFVFMQHLGAFPNRIIRQHLAQCQRLPLPKHFEQVGTTYNFTQETVDPVSGTALHKVRPLVRNQHDNFPSGTPLKATLLKAKSAKDDRTKVLQFADLLQKCLALDPTRRIELRDALQHEFFAAANTKT